MGEDPRGKEIIEERFGLKTTLNAIEPRSIRSLDRKSFETLSRQVHEQATRPAAVPDFGLDVEQDILRAVTGTPRDPTFATRLHGKDSLVATIDHGLEGIVDFLETCDGLARDDSYKTDYPWVDNIAEISNKSRIGELDDLLLERLGAREHDKLWLAVPEPIDWAQANGFKFRTSKRADTVPDLSLSDFLETIADPSALTVKVLKNKRVYYYVHDQERHKESWSVYKCICFEVSIDQDMFLLSGGKWYQVRKDFVKQVDDYINGIHDSKLRLPPYRDKGEKEYNIRVCQSRPTVLTHLDTKTVHHGGGKSKVEICDIMTKDRQLVHVKRDTDAQKLSHLFAQAAVSGELLMSDRAFRIKANKELPKPLHFPLDGFDPKRYEVVFCIITWSASERRLPFFSRVNLRANARRLRTYGYDVTMLFVPGPRSKPRARKR